MGARPARIDQSFDGNGVTKTDAADVVVPGEPGEERNDTDPATHGGSIGWGRPAPCWPRFGGQEMRPRKSHRRGNDALAARPEGLTGGTDDLAMTLRLRNTLTRVLDPVEPADGERLRMYSCGPTVYRYAHVGNLRTFLLADLIRRVVLYHGIPVTHVQNITTKLHVHSKLEAVTVALRLRIIDPPRPDGDLY